MGSGRSRSCLVAQAPLHPKFLQNEYYNNFESNYQPTGTRKANHGSVLKSLLGNATPPASIIQKCEQGNQATNYRMADEGLVSEVIVTGSIGEDSSTMIQCSLEKSLCYLSEIKMEPSATESLTATWKAKGDIASKPELADDPVDMDMGRIPAEEQKASCLVPAKLSAVEGVPPKDDHHNRATAPSLLPASTLVFTVGESSKQGDLWPPRIQYDKRNPWLEANTVGFETPPLAYLLEWGILGCAPIPESVGLPQFYSSAFSSRIARPPLPPQYASLWAHRFFPAKFNTLFLAKILPRHCFSGTYHSHSSNPYGTGWASASCGFGLGSSGSSDTRPPVGFPDPPPSSLQDTNQLNILINQYTPARLRQLADLHDCVVVPRQLLSYPPFTGLVGLLPQYSRHPPPPLEAQIPYFPSSTGYAEFDVSTTPPDLYQNHHLGASLSDSVHPQSGFDPLSVDQYTALAQPMHTPYMSTSEPWFPQSNASTQPNIPNIPIISTISTPEHSSGSANEASGAVSRAWKHACDQCPKSFRRPSALRDHMHKHTEQKQHRCANCGALIATGSNMLRHRKTDKCRSAQQAPST